MRRMLSRKHPVHHVKGFSAVPCCGLEKTSNQKKAEAPLSTCFPHQFSIAATTERKR